MEKKKYRVIWEESFHIDIEAENEEEAEKLFMSGEFSETPVYREITGVDVFNR